MTDRDHIIGTALMRFRQNWPRLDDGQEAMYTRLFHTMQDWLIPVITDRILNECEHPPRQADFYRLEQALTTQTAQQKETAAVVELPRLSPVERERFIWFVRKCQEAVFAVDFDEWEGTQHVIAQQFRVWGYHKQADEIVANIEIERDRRAAKTRKSA